MSSIAQKFFQTTVVAVLQYDPQVTSDGTRGKNVDDVRMSTHVYQEFKFICQVIFMFGCRTLLQRFDCDFIMMSCVAVPENPGFSHRREIVMDTLVL